MSTLAAVGMRMRLGGMSTQTCTSRLALTARLAFAARLAFTSRRSTLRRNRFRAIQFLAAVVATFSMTAMGRLWLFVVMIAAAAVRAFGGTTFPSSLRRRPSRG